MGRLTRGKRCLVLSAAAALGLAGLFGRSRDVRAADAPDAEGVKFFEAKIRPILAQNCVGCHGDEKQKGGLRLDTRENILKGGLDEDKKPVKVIEPGNPDKSPLIEAINYKNEDLQMPPPKRNKETKKLEDKKLSDEQIKDMTQWVKMGAPYGDKAVEAIKNPEK